MLNKNFCADANKDDPADYLRMFAELFSEFFAAECAEQCQNERDAADEALYKAGVKVQQIEGNQSSTWILMDYGDIIIHIFSKEDRLFYDLERTWRDGKVVDVSEL